MQDAPEPARAVLSTVAKAHVPYKAVAAGLLKAVQVRQNLVVLILHKQHVRHAAATGTPANSVAQELLLVALTLAKEHAILAVAHGLPKLVMVVAQPAHHIQQNPAVEHKEVVVGQTLVEMESVQVQKTAAAQIAMGNKTVVQLIIFVREEAALTQEPEGPVQKQEEHASQMIVVHI